MAFGDTFKALSDPTRREILNLLKEGPMAAGDIADRFQMTGATISHHLSILKASGLIDEEKNGKYRYYSLNTTVMDDIMNWILTLKGERPDEK